MFLTKIEVVVVFAEEAFLVLNHLNRLVKCSLLSNQCKAAPNPTGLFRRTKIPVMPPNFQNLTISLPLR